MIKIIKKSSGNFFFRGIKDFSFEEKCKYCDCRLDSRYSQIIQRLKDKNLLPNDYKMFCCDCIRTLDRARMC